MTDIGQLLQKKEFPRSQGYDMSWMLENQMGPNAVWLMEWLAEGMQFEAGMRVLDLGCGRAATSIFLAKEFGVKVWAADLWISPDGNWQRVLDAGVQDAVYPLRTEAHALPFARGFFDAIVSVDAYQYFGTDELYLAYLTRFLRSEGQLGTVMPGWMQDFDAVPPHLGEKQRNGAAFWEDGCRSFKTADFWRSLWQRDPNVHAPRVDTMPDGWRHWRDFERAIEISGKGVFPSVAEALDNDQGRYIGFVRATARASGRLDDNLYDPAIGVRVGVDG